MSNNTTDYLTVKRFKRNGIGGYFNIPFGSHLTKIDNELIFDNRTVCKATSAAAHQYFSNNSDGHAVFRFKLTSAIINKLGGFNKNPELWKIIFNDPTAKKFSRPEHESYWLWNDDFFNAPIDDLIYLANLLSINTEKLKEGSST